MKNRQNIYKIASTLLILDQIIKIIIKYNMNDIKGGTNHVTEYFWRKLI